MAVQNEQIRETGNIGYTRHRMKTNKTKTQHYAQTNTNNVYKKVRVTWYNIKKNIQ